jgi:hypothetical protein
MKKSIILLAFLFTSFFCFSQNKYTISGYVKDSSTGEYLLGANVYVKENLKGTVTNIYGFFSLTLEKGNYTLTASYIGYNDFSQTINLDKDIRSNIDLNPAAITTKEVVIIGEKSDQNVQDAQMGKIEMDIEKVKALPAFLGEVDVLKTIQLLPGVQSAGDGNSGFYVRGGGPDQNLIMLDEAVVYNASHLFGFFSVFNADAVKNIELIKGGMPANYGGRLASVLDISMKEGNSKKTTAQGGIGLISSRLTIEGPIKKDTCSYVISGRRTYIDVLAKPFIPETSPFAGSGYFFYDLNTKINYRISDKDRLFLSGYFGRDIFNFNQAESGFNVKIPWGNATTSLRWNHLFTDKLFVNTTLVFSDYKFSFGASQSEFDFKLFSGIRDYNAKFDFSYFPSVLHNIKFGGNYIFHTFIPSSVSAKSGDVEFDTGEIMNQNAHEMAAYVNDEFDVSEKLKFNLGLRYSGFMQVGPFTRYVKDELNPNKTSGEIKYESWEKVAYHQGIEPRATMRYSFNSRSSFKAAFTRNYQYIHLATLSSVSLPTDVWIPSSDVVKPQIGTLYSAGYFRNFFENKYESSVELYYKTMKNQVEYREGYVPGDAVKDNVDNNLVFGDGYSYGAEFFLKRRLGEFTGWIGYTWSKTMRVFPDLNQGNPFPARYDRRHDLSLVGTYEFNDRWTFSSTFVYATGSAITMPVSWYLIEGNVVYDYGDRNDFRMAPYHRMDIAATWTPDRKKRLAKKELKRKEKSTESNKAEISVNESILKRATKNYESSWTFSVFNVYNRANPYFIYQDTQRNRETGAITNTAKQVSLFPILPSATWNFRF